MIAHVSIPARDPKSTALFFAALIDGLAFPFPVVPDAWIAVARDRSGLAIEVYPQAMAHHPGSGEPDPSMAPAGPQAMPWEDQIRPEPRATGASGFHCALASRLPDDQVLARARALGWRAIQCERAGVFGVIEVWVDNVTLVEVLNEAQVKRYRAFMQPEGCAGMFGPGLAPEPVPAAG